MNELINKTLKPNGLVYISYKALPGWAGLMPIWIINYSHARDIEGGSFDKAKAGLEHLSFLRKEESD